MITPNADKDVEKQDHSHTADGNVKCYNHSGKLFGNFLKNYTCNYIQPSNFFPEHLSQRNEDLRLHKNLNINIYGSLICNILKLEQPVYLSVGKQLNKINHSIL